MRKRCRSYEAKIGAARCIAHAAQSESAWLAKLLLALSVLFHHECRLICPESSRCRCRQTYGPSTKFRNYEIWLPTAFASPRSRAFCGAPSLQFEIKQLFTASRCAVFQAHRSRSDALAEIGSSSRSHHSPWMFAHFRRGLVIWRRIDESQRLH